MRRRGRMFVGAFKFSEFSEPKRIGNQMTPRMWRLNVLITFGEKEDYYISRIVTSKNVNREIAEINYHRFLLKEKRT